ncbi:signal recognition particle-docking protein FtsY [Glycocaulis profundi]|nr:signal recognition particle-docking protein FtsY [Glycocaulis profundi]
MSWFGFGRKKKDRDQPPTEPPSQEPPVQEPPAPEPAPAPPVEPEPEPVREPGPPPPEPAETHISPSADDPGADDSAAEIEARTGMGHPHGPGPCDVAAPPAAPAPPPEPAKSGFMSKLASGLSKSSGRLTEQMSSVFTARTMDAEALEEVEELLIAADIGAPVAAKVAARLGKERFGATATGKDVREALAAVVAEELLPCQKKLDMSGPAPRVVLFVGVNGSGKTTTLGKIAVKMVRDGGKVITVAGDTFRAAAVEQLEVWSRRAGADFMSRPIGADAAGLAFDAVEKARAEGADAVLIDTAGRLQNKAELMDELRKIIRVIRKLDPSAPHQVVLVLDGTVGSNAISQADAFLQAADVSAVIMTKLDGTAKGGALVQVAEKFRLPIPYVGVGEGEADLQDFDAKAFARALAGLEG